MMMDRMPQGQGVLVSSGEFMAGILQKVTNFSEWLTLEV